MTRQPLLEASEIIAVNSPGNYFFLEEAAAWAAQDHVLVTVELVVPDHDVLERPPLSFQEVVRPGRHLLVLLDHAPCPAVLLPLHFSEVGGHVSQTLNYQDISEFLVDLSHLWMGKVGF